MPRFRGVHLRELLVSMLAVCAALCMIGTGSARASDVVSYPSGGAQNPCGQASATQWIPVAGGGGGSLEADMSTDAYIYLTGSVTALASLNQGEANLTIDLCGYDLYAANAAPGFAGIEVPSGDSFTIEDTSSTNQLLQGTLTALGNSEAGFPGVGAGIGGGAGGATSGSVTIDSGNVVAVGAAGVGSNAGGAAGIGGGDYEAEIGDSGTVTINGGVVTAQGGNSNGTTFGGGAGIGGGSATFGQAVGGEAGPVDITGGQVSAYGGWGDGHGGGAGAAIGGGGGRYGGAGGGLTGATLTGGSVYTQAGVIPNDGGSTPGYEGAGIGQGGGGYNSAGIASAGTITVGAGSGSGTVELDGALGGLLSVEPNWTLDVPASMPDTSWNGSSVVAGTYNTAYLASAGGTNEGIIEVEGHTYGTGITSTHGVIVAEAGGAQDLQVGVDSPADTDISVDYPAAEAADDVSIAYGAGAGTPTLALAGLSLPAEPAVPGETAIGWEADGTIVTNTTDLSSVAIGTVVELTPDYGNPLLQAPSAPAAPIINYTLSGTRGAHGWYVGPVTVSFSCGTDAGATVSCPAPQTLDSSGKNQSATGTATATSSSGGSEETPASVTAFFIDIDLTKPSVSITGANNGRIYTKAPKPRCKASDAVSGIASCKLTVTRKHTKSGYVETVTAVATSNSGVTTKTSLKFTFKQPAKKKHTKKKHS